MLGGRLCLRAGRSARGWWLGCLAGVGVALLMLTGLLLSQPGSALAEGGTTYANCAAASSFPNDLNAVPNGSSATFNFPSDCTINLTTELAVNAGVSVTINGNGLTLAGNRTATTPGSFDIIDIVDDRSNPSTLTLNQVTVADGFYGISDPSSAATVSLESSTIRDNTLYGVSAGNVTATDSTVNNNDGGIFANGDTVVTDSTITDSRGDGIRSEGDGTVTDSTIASNDDYGVNIHGHATLTANILAGNGLNNLHVSCYFGGGLSDSGYNLSTDATCNFQSPTSQNNVPISGAGGLNLQLLADNGGPTLTIGLDPGSIAIDYGPAGSCPTTTDQRGVSRPQGTACDVGAYEVIQGSYPQTESTCPSQYQLQSDLDLATSMNGNLLRLDLPSNCTIDLTSSLAITAGENIAINGNGAILDQTVSSDDVILINDANSPNPSKLLLNQLSIEGGQSGVIDRGNAATVNLVGSSFTGNGVFALGAFGIEAQNVDLTASTVSDYGSAGISAASNATITNSTISDNHAEGVLGSTVTVTGSAISGNIDNAILGYDNGTVTVTNSTLSGNGNGIIAGNSATVDGSTISGNHGYGIDASTSATVTDSTIAGNRSNGVYAIDTATVTSSTVVGNLNGVVVPLHDGSASLTATILSDNTGANCSIGSSVTNLTDGGYNLSTDTSCGFSGTSQQGSTVADGLDLLPLGNYGGPTPTIALGPGSIAIDQVPVGTTASIGGQTIVICPSTSDPAFTDQRGIPRPQGDACDTGAYEAPALSLTVNPSSPNGKNGWYTTDPTVTLGYSGLAIGADSTDASQAQVASCSGLSHTATTLNDSGTVSLTISEEGTTAIGSCAVKQGTTALGFSTSGKTLFLTLKVDTTNPTVQCSPPGNYQTTWYDSNQTVKCTASDDISGLADSSLATFSLTTDVASGTVDATAATGTQQVCNNAGTCVIAGPYDFKIDLQDPTVQASAKLADGSSYTFGDWTNQAVTVSFSANDGDGSGVKSISYTVGSTPIQTISGDSGSFTISDQGEYTISYVATDNAGNSSATQSAVVDLDLHAPGISITSPRAQSYALNAPLTAGYGCSVAPGISPVTTCSATVTLPDKSSQTIASGDRLPTNELGSYTFTVNAANAAGNTSGQTVVYTVGYTLTPMPGNTSTVNQGYFALIRFAPEDANSHDYASRDLQVTSVALDGPSGQVIPFVHQFQFTMAHNTPQYQLEINTRDLATGTWTLVIQIGSENDATTGTMQFTVK